MPDDYVLDTSAIVAVLEAEPRAGTVIDLLRRAGRLSGRIYAPFIALMEAEYTMLRRLSVERADTAIRSVELWPVTVAESSPVWRRAAATLKARGGLSLADAWIASLAIIREAELVHKDREFDSIPGLRSVRL